MNRFACDLHIHSCLSPCADDDMTPGNIAGMAALNGLSVAALTDHNTSRNCPAFFRLAESCGVIPVAGMELTTAEDVHMLCLFPDLESAMTFDSFVRSKRVPVKNKPAIFGRQLLIDENDEVCGEEEFLLINAVNLSLEEAFDEVKRHGGVCCPAHIDRPANGMIAVLGDFPPDPPFTFYELNDESALGEHRERFPIIRTLPHISSSDAHTLGAVAEEGFPIELDASPDDPAGVRRRLIDYLAGKGPHGGTAFHG